MFISTDTVELTKKIKSLQSKQCRLSQAYKTVVGAGIESPELNKQIDEVAAEIARLNAMRGTQPKQSRVKSVEWYLLPSNSEN